MPACWLVAQVGRRTPPARAWMEPVTRPFGCVRERTVPQLSRLKSSAASKLSKRETLFERSFRRRRREVTLSRYPFKCRCWSCRAHLTVALRHCLQRVSDGLAKRPNSLLRIEPGRHPRFPRSPLTILSHTHAKRFVGKLILAHRLFFPLKSFSSASKDAAS
jgi:hypothetical protein